MANMERLTAADGHGFDCWMHPAEGTAWGGLVILQEIFGVTDQLKRVAARYVGAGLNVAIPALFDRHERGAVIPFDQPLRGRDLMLACEPDATLRDVAAAVAALSAMGGKVAAMGFCWGGGLAIRAAQTLDVGCGVAFYGTRLPHYLDRPLRVPVQGHYGTRDDHIPEAMRAEALAALPGFEIHLYDAGHAFANDARPAAYDAVSAEAAHARTLDFLRAHLA